MIVGEQIEKMTVFLLACYDLKVVWIKWKLINVSLVSAEIKVKIASVTFFTSFFFFFASSHGKNSVRPQTNIGFLLSGKRETLLAMHNYFSFYLKQSGIKLSKFKIHVCSNSKRRNFFIKRNSLLVALKKKHNQKKFEKRKTTNSSNFNSNESSWAAPSNCAARVADLNVQSNDHHSTSEYKLFYVNT